MTHGHPHRRPPRHRVPRPCTGRGSRSLTWTARASASRRASAPIAFSRVRVPRSRSGRSNLRGRRDRTVRDRSSRPESRVRGAASRRCVPVRAHPFAILPARHLGTRMDRASPPGSGRRPDTKRTLTSDGARNVTRDVDTRVPRQWSQCRARRADRRDSKPPRNDALRVRADAATGVGAWLDLDS